MKNAENRGKIAFTFLRKAQLLLFQLARNPQLIIDIMWKSFTLSFTVIGHEVWIAKDKVQLITCHEVAGAAYRDNSSTLSLTSTMDDDGG